MEYIDKEINLKLSRQFTPIKNEFEKIIKNENLCDANILCWVPHEVSSLVQIGWENGLIEDLEAFLEETAPPNKWIKHDEPNTPFRYNFFQHIRPKLIGNNSLALIIKNEKLYLGKYQDLYFYSPVYKEVSNQTIFCRVLKLK